MRALATSRPRGSVALAALAFATLTWLGTTAHALDVPELKTPVTDLAGVLDAGAQAQLNEALAQYREKTGHHFALLIVPSLEGEPIEEATIRLLEKGSWRLGDEKADNGLLMMIALRDRRMRIEVGYGLEGAIPDALASRIVREVMQPAFRQGDFKGGISQAMGLLMKAGAGEKVDVQWKRPGRQSRRSRRSSSGGLISLLILLFFFIGPMFFRRGRRGGGGFFYMGGFGGGGGGFGGGGDSGGGGGFGDWGGGGGGFGGGGASGDW